MHSHTLRLSGVQDSELYPCPIAQAPGVPHSFPLPQESRWVSGAQDLVCPLHHLSVAVEMLTLSVLN